VVCVLESAATPQQIVPDAVLVGASAAALWADHWTWLPVGGASLLVAVHGGDGLMTGETIRDLLMPLIGKSGSLSMAISRAGHIGFIASENTKLTGVQLGPDGLLRLERQTGWVVIDPGRVVAVVWDSEPEASAGQFL
jgi:hypothetical protein